jgi:hypothetical protein
MREHRVHADSVDADAFCRGRLVPGPKLGQLHPSTTREIQDIEEEDQRLVLLKRIRKREFRTTRRRQLEFGRFVPNL